MFIGHFLHTVDDKGRLAIPAKFRSKLADGLVVTRGMDPCLFVYNMTEWNALAQKVGSLPVTNPTARLLQRIFFADASDCQLDQQGRFVLPASLRQHADLNGEVMVVGAFNRLEIWSRERWEQVRDQVEQQDGAITQQLADLGI